MKEPLWRPRRCCHVDMTAKEQFVSSVGKSGSERGIGTIRNSEKSLFRCHVNVATSPKFCY
jgi:hypothetical protein